MSIDQTVSDFDGVTFHISTPETKTKIMVSLQIRCFQDLLRYGAEEVLNREYGPYVVPPEPGYDFSILIDLENLPAEKGWFLPLLHCQYPARACAETSFQRHETSWS